MGAVRYAILDVPPWYECAFLGFQVCWLLAHPSMFAQNSIYYVYCQAISLFKSHAHIMIIGRG